MEAVQTGWRRTECGTALDRQVATLIFAETIGQLTGGLPMGQNEMFRPPILAWAKPRGRLRQILRHFSKRIMRRYAARGCAQALAKDMHPARAFQDAELDTIRDQYRRFTEARLSRTRINGTWRMSLFPMQPLRQWRRLAHFGVCIPEEFGGLGLSKLVMCVITEELSRGWLGAGSLGTRSEIAGELIALGGTGNRRRNGCPRSRAERSCQRRCLPNPIPGPISARSRPAPAIGEG